MFNTIKNYALAAAMTASPYAKEAILLTKRHASEHADLVRKHAGDTKAIATRLNHNIEVNG